MKKIQIIFLLLSLSLAGFGQVTGEAWNYINYSTKIFNNGSSINIPLPEYDYYFSVDGSDDDDGLTRATAKQTIDGTGGFNDLTLTAGQSVAFRQGDTWTGATMIIPSSGGVGNPITITSYSETSIEGQKPIISGFETVTGWTDETGGIYSKVVAIEGDSLSMVTINGMNTGMGRYPDIGTWLTYDSHVRNVSITDNELTDTPNWTGAELVLRQIKWSMPRCLITDHTGTTITYVPNNTVWNEVDGYGYFIQDDLKTLTSFGEWYYETATSKFYMYFGSELPTDYEVKISAVEIGVYIDDKDYITIKDIEFEGINSYGLYNEFGQNLVIDNCIFKFIGVNGIYNPQLSSNSSFVINDNDFSNINDHAINLRGTTNSADITNNTIDSIGLILGMNDALNVDGIAIYGSNSLIQYNSITNIGHSGIVFRQGVNTSISNNFVIANGLSQYDAGAIYIWDTENTTIENNIVIGTDVITTGIGGSADEALIGIYVDENCDTVDINNNTAANFSSLGITYYSSKNGNIKNNTAFNNDAFQIGLSYNDSYSSIGYDITGMDIKNNLMVAGNVDQNLFRNYNNVSAFDNFGLSDSNIFVPDAQPTYITTYNYSAYSYYDLTGWQTLTAKDTNSDSLDIALGINETSGIVYNGTKTAKLFYPNNASNIDSVTATSGSITFPLTIQPFSSLVVKGLYPDCIQDYEDTTPPIITTFTLPATASSMVVSISELEATGNATQYIITTSGTEPNLHDYGWQSIYNLNYFMPEDGTVTLYCWVRDAAGNISSSANDVITITGTSGTLGTTTVLAQNTSLITQRRAFVVSTTEKSLLKSIFVYNSGTAGDIVVGVYTDNGAAGNDNNPETKLAGKTGTFSGTAGWNEFVFDTPVIVESGVKLWIAWHLGTGTSVMKWDNGTNNRVYVTATYDGTLPTEFGTYDDIGNFDYSMYLEYVK